MILSELAHDRFPEGCASITKPMRLRLHVRNYMLVGLRNIAVFPSKIKNQIGFSWTLR